MPELFINIWFFVIFISSSIMIYQLLKIFDYSKILLKGKVGALRVLLVIIAIILGFAFATMFVSVIERIITIANR